MFIQIFNENISNHKKLETDAKILGYLPIMSVNARDSAGTRRDKTGTNRDKAGTNRDKQGQTGTNRDIPFLSLLVPTCPCLSMHPC